MPEFQPISPFRNFLAGRQARQEEQAGQQRNALAQMQLTRENQLNALAANPNASPEAYARLGRSDVANSLTNIQNDRTDRAIATEAAQAKRFALAADYALNSPNPKQSLEQNFPDIVSKVGDRWASLDDAGVRQIAQQVLEKHGPAAGIAPRVKLETFGDFKNPGAGIWTRDPVTGEPKQVSAPWRPEKPQAQGAQWRYLTPNEIKQRGLPEGTSAQIDVNSGEVDILNKREGLSAQEQKTIREAKMRMPRLNAAIRRVDRLGQAVTALSKNSVFDGGPLDAKALRWTKQGQEIEAAAAQLMPELQALTRVPGIGSQSDLEARLASLALPSLSMSPEVNARSQAELASFISDLKDAYASLLSGGQPPVDIPPPDGPSDGWSIEEVQ